MITVMLILKLNILLLLYLYVVDQLLQTFLVSVQTVAIKCQM
jgi:hypothetical protein